MKNSHLSTRLSTTNLFFHTILLALFISIALFQSGEAQAQTNKNILERVSAATRSDGKGQVIRFHLQQAIDSFQVYQPDVDLIQLRLYSSKLDTSNIKLAQTSTAFDEISFYDIPKGLGVDIYLKQGKYYEAKGYPDSQSKDLLLGLTKIGKQQVEYLTEGLEPIIWSSLSINQDSLLLDDLPLTDNLPNSGYNIFKDKAKFDVVVLDPGHGGHDTGAIGYKNVKEKNIVLQIAKKVGGYINKYLPDVKVVYTRDDDSFIELKERGSIANRNEGDMFVSIHCNSSRSRQPYGSEVYFLGLERSKTALNVMKRENKVIREGDKINQRKLSQEDLLVYELTNSGYIATSERVAGMIEHQLDDRAQRRSRGVKQARFVVLYHASMPAVLVETGFISNPGEARYLSSDYGQSIIASAIFRSVRNYKKAYEKSQHYDSE